MVRPSPACSTAATSGCSASCSRLTQSAAAAGSGRRASRPARPPGAASSLPVTSLVPSSACCPSGSSATKKTCCSGAARPRGDPFRPGPQQVGAQHQAVRGEHVSQRATPVHQFGPGGRPAAPAWRPAPVWAAPATPSAPARHRRRWHWRHWRHRHWRRWQHRRWQHRHWRHWRHRHWRRWQPVARRTPRMSPAPRRTPARRPVPRRTRTARPPGRRRAGPGRATQLPVTVVHPTAGEHGDARRETPLPSPGPAGTPPVPARVSRSSITVAAGRGLPARRVTACG